MANCYVTTAHLRHRHTIFVHFIIDVAQQLLHVLADIAAVLVCLEAARTVLLADDRRAVATAAGMGLALARLAAVIVDDATVLAVHHARHGVAVG